MTLNLSICSELVNWIAAPLLLFVQCWHSRVKTNSHDLCEDGWKCQKRLNVSTNIRTKSLNLNSFLKNSACQFLFFCEKKLRPTSSLQQSLLHYVWWIYFLQWNDVMNIKCQSLTPLLPRIWLKICYLGPLLPFYLCMFNFSVDCLYKWCVVQN